MRPVVGIGVLVQKNGKFLLGRRMGKHGRNTWSVPGGHLEFGETFEECAAREVLEESNVKIKNIKFYTSVNNVFRDENKHSVTIFMLSDWSSGIAKTTEPDKFIDVGWFSLNDLPSPLFLPVIQLQKTKPELFKQ